MDGYNKEMDGWIAPDFMGKITAFQIWSWDHFYIYVQDNFAPLVFITPVFYFSGGIYYFIKVYAVGSLHDVW